MIYPSGFDTSTAYTGNQPLLFGGQLYMWNRWLNVRYGFHGTHYAYTKGPQSQAILTDGKGKPVLISVPIKACPRGTPADQVKLHDPGRWAERTIKTLFHLYGKAPYYYGLGVEVEDAIYYATKAESLAEFNVHFWNMIAAWLCLKPLPESRRDLSTPVTTEDPSEYMACAGAELGAKVYLGGKTAQEAYLRVDDFLPQGMSFVSQDFTPAPYKKEQSKLGGSVNVLDVLFLGGPKLLKQLCLVDPLKAS